MSHRCICFWAFETFGNLAYLYKILWQPKPHRWGFSETLRSITQVILPLKLGVLLSGPPLLERPRLIPRCYRYRVALQAVVRYIGAGWYGESDVRIIQDAVLPRPVFGAIACRRLEGAIRVEFEHLCPRWQGVTLEAGLLPDPNELRSQVAAAWRG